MKRIIAYFAATAILLSVITSASAANRSDLERVHQKLSQYFYMPFYEDSQYYDTFREEMDQSKLMLDDPTSTEEEIEQQYEDLKNAYTLITRDTFDYSLLTNLSEDYEKLALELFTSDTIQGISDVAEKIYKELEAPTLYKRGNRSKSEYQKDIEKLITSLEKEFRTAFQGLELKEIQKDDFSKSDLQNLLIYCNLCAQESYFGSSSAWNTYQKTVTEIKTALENDKTKDDECYDFSQKLLTDYQKLTSSRFDLTQVKNEAKLLQTLNRYDYSEASWNSYQKNAESLAALVEKPIFLYLKYLGSTENASAYVDAYFSARVSAVAQTREQLVPQEQINKLSALCNTYHYSTASEGLNAKLKKLLDRVDQGYQVLRNENAQKNDVEVAIVNIEEAAEDLRMAEIYLVQEQEEQAQNDVQTIRLSIVFAIVSLLLSLLFAFILSHRQSGRLNINR